VLIVARNENKKVEDLLFLFVSVPPRHLLVLAHQLRRPPGEIKRPVNARQAMANATLKDRMTWYRLMSLLRRRQKQPRTSPACLPFLTHTPCPHPSTLSLFLTVHPLLPIPHHPSLTPYSLTWTTGTLPGSRR